jgi:predicted dehydrogenase
VASIRVAVAGCGSVSHPYLTDLRQSPLAEIVSVCDVIRERAAHRAAEFDVPNVFGDVDEMLAGPPFDLLINLTSMPSHGPVNLQGLQAGRHVLSEKPLASTLEEGRTLLDIADTRGVRLFGAPIVVTSPAYRCLAELIASGEIGAVHAAHGCYGHGGPDWGPWFYRRGGGSLFDLGVYNITLFTGLLGPVRSVVAMTGTVVPERTVEGERVRVESDDNTMVLLDHGGAVFSCVQTGFVYGSRGHLYSDAEPSIEFTGTRGYARLLGYDWAPRGVAVLSQSTSGWEVRCEDQHGYSWECGARYLVEALAAGGDVPFTGQHAFHVLEVMLAAHRSSAEGRRVDVTSVFAHAG